MLRLLVIAEINNKNSVEHNYYFSTHISYFVQHILFYLSPISNNVGTTYERPIDDDAISTTIGSRNIDNYVNDKAQKFFEYIDNIFSWIPANPSKSAVIQALSSVFVFAENPYDSAAYLNTKIGMKKLLSTINSPDPFVTYITGEKGIGKTFTLNQFLNIHTEEMELSATDPVVWYRIDASKVYLKWGSLSEKDKQKWTIEKFLKVQVCYVTLKGEANNIFKEIQEDKNNSFFETLLTTAQSPQFSRGDILPSNLLKEFKALLEDIKIRKGRKDLDKLIFEDIVNSNLYENIDILFESIRIYIANSGIEFLIIFDGIDNVDFESDYESYVRFLKELRPFVVPNDHPLRYARKVIVTIRESTLSHLKKLYPMGFQLTRREMNIKPLSLKRILKRKVWVASKPRNYFKQIISSLISVDPGHFNKHRSTLEGLEAEFIKLTNSYFRKLSSLIPGDKSEGSIDVLYHKNLRSFSQGFISAFKYNELSVERKKIRNEYILSEALILGGDMYIDSALNTAYDYTSDKYFTPNLLWFPHGEASNQVWHGLCGLRLLQACYKRAYTREQLVQAMCEYFSYKQEIVDQTIDRLTKHRLMKARYNIVATDQTPMRSYTTTDRGYFLIGFLLYDINTFYYFALDTPFHLEVIKTSNLVQVHKNSDTQLWANYSEACITTSLTLIRYIELQNSTEIGYLDTKQQDLFRQHQLRPGDFYLPVIKSSDETENVDWYDNIVKGMQRHLNVMQSRNPDRYDDFVNNVLKNVGTIS